MTLTLPIAGMVLDGCVLAILREGDTYGYDLTQNLQNQIEISESTLYPVLRRLQKEDYLETYDLPHSGRNRRYYKLTALGLQRLEATKVAWQVYINQVNSLLRFNQEPTTPLALPTGVLSDIGELDMSVLDTSDAPVMPEPPSVTIPDLLPNGGQSHD